MPTITTSIKELANSFPDYYNTAIKYFSNLPEDSILNKIKINEIIENMKESIKEIRQKELERSFGRMEGFIKECG